ncbi:radical sam domain protein, putative [Heliomicrobium modesticaldum Ice1]|uniref:7-carboxy-7-deazaguanine synthase n=1 Tax=Heliobacterium modesticaldum (strain ATCC 51547 / Ice1) TaxID=498761 RepID=B0TAY1_HELMI|nr:radical sam domain protein, putative [Heliomicrobium modesticaldum Ice1]
MNNSLPTADLVEIMVSAQGEGPWIGCRQVFLRFFGCNLSCSYCDTPGSRGPRPSACRIEKEPGSSLFDLWENPVTVDRVAEYLCHTVPIHSVSLTGGEPLLHVEFIQQLIPLLGAQRPDLYLETNGTLPEQLALIVDDLDYVSMDLKTPLDNHWDLHRLFLRIASRKKGYVKIVITPTTALDVVQRAAAIIEEEAPHFPLVLQPVTGKTGLPLTVPGHLLNLQGAALAIHRDVRIIPQVHPILGIL